MWSLLPVMESRHDGRFSAKDSEITARYQFESVSRKPVGSNADIEPSPGNTSQSVKAYREFTLVTAGEKVVYISNSAEMHIFTFSSRNVVKWGICYEKVCPSVCLSLRLSHP